MENDELAIRPVMGLSLTTDHRVVDGDPSGEFLTRLCDKIEKIRV
ncbi:2-oxo acid dehydrogenase subunit E2 [Emcibacter sp.]